MCDKTFWSMYITFFQLNYHKTKSSSSFKSFKILKDKKKSDENAIWIFKQTAYLLVGWNTRNFCFVLILIIWLWILKPIVFYFILFLLFFNMSKKCSYSSFFYRVMDKVCLLFIWKYMGCCCFLKKIIELIIIYMWMSISTYEF